MSLQSMTGFARAEGRAECGAASGKWVWELRSVNSKGLDIRLRLPGGFETVEQDCRKMLSATFSRGSIQGSLNFERDGQEALPRVNEHALAAVLDAVENLRQQTGAPPPAAEAILALRGVLELGEDTATAEETAARNELVKQGLSGAIAELADARISEGRQIVEVSRDQVRQIEQLTRRIETDPSRTPEAIGKRLADQLAPLLQDVAAIDPQRLHQEAAILATKADLREELDRLSAHVKAADELLSSKGPCGRKLDFLAQEFNRECNTICSKSNAASVTSAGLEMKVVIDQFREQIQNIE